MVIAVLHHGTILIEFNKCSCSKSQPFPPKYHGIVSFLKLKKLTINLKTDWCKDCVNFWVWKIIHFLLVDQFRSNLCWLVKLNRYCKQPCLVSLRYNRVIALQSHYFAAQGAQFISSRIITFYNNHTVVSNV